MRSILNFKIILYYLQWEERIVPLIVMMTFFAFILKTFSNHSLFPMFSYTPVEYVLMCNVLVMH